jgi:hypothetical protein
MRAGNAAGGTNHVETVGVDRNRVEWKPTLDAALSDLVFWGRICERRNRGPARVTTRATTSEAPSTTTRPGSPSRACRSRHAHLMGLCQVCD